METPGTKNMGMGLLWFAGGALITFVTYQAARGGGIFIVTSGAIVVGALQFVVGAFQFLRAKAAGHPDC